MRIKNLNRIKIHFLFGVSEQTSKKKKKRKEKTKQNQDNKKKKQDNEKNESDNDDDDVMDESNDKIINAFTKKGNFNEYKYLFKENKTGQKLDYKSL